MVSSPDNRAERKDSLKKIAQSLTLLKAALLSSFTHFVHMLEVNLMYNLSVSQGFLTEGREFLALKYSIDNTTVL